MWIGDNVITGSDYFLSCIFLAHVHNFSYIYIVSCCGCITFLKVSIIALIFFLLKLKIQNVAKHSDLLCCTVLYKSHGRLCVLHCVLCLLFVLYCVLCKSRCRVCVSAG